MELNKSNRISIKNPANFQLAVKHMTERMIDRMHRAKDVLFDTVNKSFEFHDKD